MDPPVEDMDYLYQESRGLMSVAPDSIQRFAAKFQSFVVSNPEVQSNPDYYDILDNIHQAAQACGLTITVTINTVWEGETEIHF